MVKSKQSKSKWQHDPKLRRKVFARRDAMADALSHAMECSSRFQEWSHDEILTAGMELADAIVTQLGDEPWLSAN